MMGTGGESEVLYVDGSTEKGALNVGSSVAGASGCGSELGGRWKNDAGGNASLKFGLAKDISSQLPCGLNEAGFRDEQARSTARARLDRVFIAVDVKGHRAKLARHDNRFAKVNRKREMGRNCWLSRKCFL